MSITRPSRDPWGHNIWRDADEPAVQATPDSEPPTRGSLPAWPPLTGSLSFNMTATAQAQLASRADQLALNMARQAEALTGINSRTINGNTIRGQSFDRVWIDEADAIAPYIGSIRGTISGTFANPQPRVSSVVSTHQRDYLIREGWTPPGQENSPYSRVRNDLISKEGTNVEVRRVFDAMAGIMWLETVETLALHMTNKCEMLEKQLAEIRSREVAPQFPPAESMVSLHRRVPDPSSPLGYRDEIIREPGAPRWSY